MKTKAVRIHGQKDLRLEEFELPAPKDDEILAHVISDSICMSSYKAAGQGAQHKRIPKDVDRNPTVLGHEFCGELVEVGAKWGKQFQAGQKFSIQPALNYEKGPVGVLSAPGYSYRYIGGDATYVIIPREVMEQGCLLAYQGDAYFKGSLAEPMSCIVGSYHASYHTSPGSYQHRMGIVEGGSLALLAGVGPMGLGAIDYGLHGGRRPARLLVADIDDVRLARAASIYTVEHARELGVTLAYMNTKGMAKPEDDLLAWNGGRGFDDVFVFAPVAPVVELGDRLLGPDGCLNFFAGPTDPEFSPRLNFYNVHYGATHVVGTSGGNTADMVESLELMGSGRVNPATMVTHVGGLDAVIDTTLRLPQIPGGKKLIYTNISLPLTAIAELEEKGKADPLLASLARLTARNNGLWSKEAEELLLAKAPRL
jgi:threonine dehydrogenase-like Zn-dependent dehydrogenase